MSTPRDSHLLVAGTDGQGHELGTLGYLWRFQHPDGAGILPSCLHVVQDGQAVGAMQADKLLLGTKPWTVKSDGKASIATVMVDTSVSIST